MNTLFTPSLGSINSYSVTVKQPDLIKPPVMRWVSVDENDKNNIVWKKQINDAIDHYNVYRSSTIGGENWELAGTVDYNSETYLKDLNSFARVQAYKYRIGAVDKCGNEVFSNVIFKTIFLKFRDINTEKTEIEWNESEGLDVQKYYVYRGLRNERLTLMDSTSSTVSNYIDIHKDKLNYVYMVEAIGTDFDSVPQLASTKMNRIRQSLALIRSVSNKISNTYDSVFSQYSDSDLIIYPNPLTSKSVIKFPYFLSQHYELTIYDILGNKVYTQNIDSGEFFIYKNNLKAGMYLLRINCGSKSIQKRLIVGGY